MRVAAAACRSSSTAAGIPLRLGARAAALRNRLSAKPNVSSSVRSPQPASEGFEHLHHELESPSLLQRDTCTAMLEQCKRRDDAQKTSAILGAMAAGGLKPSAHDLALAANTYASTRNADLAARILADLRGAGLSNGLSATSSHTSVSTLILRGYRLNGDAAGALQTWEQMQLEEVRPSAAGLQHLLVACGRAGDWRRARDILTHAEAPPPNGLGLATDVRQWNAVLAGCVNVGDMREAESMLDMMLMAPPSDPHRFANTTSFNTVLHGYIPDWAGEEGHDARLARAEALVTRMKEAAIPPDTTTVGALIDLHKLNVQRVQELLSEARGAGISIDIPTYGRAIQAHLWARLPDQAWALIENMRNEGLVPDRRSYSRFIVAAQSVGLIDDADRLYREAQTAPGSCP